MLIENSCFPSREERTSACGYRYNHNLLPFNDKKGIDFDLLLLQQARCIRNQLKVMNTELNSFDKYILNTLNKSLQNIVFNRKYQSIYRYKNKVNWLWDKQIERRRTLPLKLKQRIKLKLWGAVWKKIICKFSTCFLAYFKITFSDLGKSEILLN